MDLREIDCEDTNWITLIKDNPVAGFCDDDEPLGFKTTENSVISLIMDWSKKTLYYRVSSVNQLVS
jgi:hypothetical protein